LSIHEDRKKMNKDKAISELAAARQQFLTAKQRYLTATRHLEQIVYRTDRPALLRKQA
jgi:hypothetical protein